MITLASLRSDGWTAWPELVDGFVGLRNIPEDDEILARLDALRAEEG